MRTKIFSSIAILSILFTFAACTSDLEYKDVAITPVDQLYSPKDNQNVKLLSSATANTFFEWSSALAEDGNSPLYEVVFDKAEGDFSHPVYRMPSDGNGSRNFAAISHKTLDKIAQLAGLGSGETGKIKWTVASSRGINHELSKEVRTVNITRLLGFSELPAQVFITGEASEGGADVSKALQMSSPENGVFEIFTKLEGGKTYHFSDNTAGAYRTFFIDGASLKESLDGKGEAKVGETGVYRINLDFNIAAVSVKRVISVGFFFSPSNKVTVPFEYQSNGTWVGKGATPFHQESWGRDERYKFEMVLDSNGTEEVVHWGPTNASLDSRPSDDPAEDYFYMKQWPASQWGNKWKLHGNFDTEKNGGKDTKFTFIVNASGPYRHVVEYAD